MDTSALELLLTKEEFAIFCGEVNRKIKTAEKLLGGLSVAERRRIAQYEIAELLKAIKQERRA